MRGEGTVVRWRALLDALHVPWYDRGPNTSRGHISCKCPWCGNADPSHHLSINESNGAYRCYRDPQLHAGWSLPWLLLALGVNSRQIDGLLTEFAGGAPARTLEGIPARPVEWERYAPAGGDTAALEYLRLRGYPDPAYVCRAFDLRFTRFGRMAWRILFPLDAGGETLGVIGRATRSTMEPRYLSQDPYGGCLYIPPHRNTSVLLLCEGAFDALTAVFAAPHIVTAAAILGTDIPDARKLTLDLLARDMNRVVYIPDTNHVPSATYRLIKELESLPHIQHIDRAPLPRGKDMGEWASDLGGLRQWIEENFGSSRVGMEPAKIMPTPSSERTPGGCGHT